MKKRKSYAAKINFCAARRICGNKRTVETNEFPERRKILRGNSYFTADKQEKYYAATVILPRDKQEKRNAALRIKKKVDTAAKLKQ